MTTSSPCSIHSVWRSSFEPACVAEGLRTDAEAVAGVADGEEVRVVLVPGLGAGVEVRHDCWPAVDRAHQRALHEPDGDLR
jgi:hypothetical protein